MQIAITFADEVSSAFANVQSFLDVYQVTIIWDLPQSFGKMLYIFVSVDHFRWMITTKILIPTTLRLVTLDSPCLVLMPWVRSVSLISSAE